MPIETPHFGLKAFVLGDAFSASIDKERFLRIDKHMAFVSDIIGYGIIDGWAISSPSNMTIRVSSGWGMIDRFVTRTFGYVDKTITDNNTIYVWMKRRAGVIGEVSAFVGPTSASYIDTTPPDAPVNVELVEKTAFSISIEWQANTEVDIDSYNIYRSNDNITYEKIFSTSTISYIDIELSDDTFYYYKITAVDFAGLESSFSSVLSVKTLKDLTPPGDPSTIRITNGYESANLVWRKASFGNIAFYRAYLTPVTQEGISSGTTSIIETPSNNQYMSIDNLTNGQRYEIVLKSVGTNDEESDGVKAYLYPVNFDGPKEVTDVNVSDSENTGVLSKINLDISWLPYINAYDSHPAFSFEVMLEEFSGNGTTVKSEWIRVPSDFSLQIQVYPYIDSTGQIAYRPVLERTEYFVTIRSISDNNLKSQGFTCFYKTKSYQNPLPVRNLNISQRENQTLAVTWQNSASIYDHNLLTIEIKKDSTITLLFDGYNYGKSSSYLIDSAYISPGTDYNVKITAIDEFGNASEEISASFSIPSIGSISRPPVPAHQIGHAGNKQVDLIWDIPEIPYIKGFRIWRAPDQVYYTASDFTLVETILDPNRFSYSDYEVSNDQTYVYFITTLDIYDQESLNPNDDEYFDYNLISATPRSSGSLISPSSLSLNISGLDVQLSWNTTGGQFDGYEIFRSINNKYSWEKVAITDPAVTSYTDSNVLLNSNGTYYYIVRKFKNESDVFITESRNTVVGAILLGKVITNNGNIEFDISSIRKIKDLEDPIKEYATSLISLHKHQWYGDDDDRRINLSNAMTVNDWDTIDYQSYVTQTDISETTTYKVYINGEESEILSTLNKDSGELFFERRLAAGDFSYDSNETFPYNEPPVVEILFYNLEEVQNQLPRDRIESVSSQQVTSGFIKNAQLPSINHQGRIKEKLLPVQVDMFAIDDGYRYSTVSSSEIIGSGIVWYDVFNDANNQDLLVASTSDGIYVSLDFGTNWIKKFEPLTPVSKLFYSSAAGLFFAASNRGVLVTGHDSGNVNFNVWSEISGIETSKVVRNIIEDNQSNIFCSTDLGVFKLRNLPGRGLFTWTQTPIFGPRSTDAYAILYDSFRGRIIVSNELGIFETYNAGLKWTFSPELPEQRIIYDFYQIGDSIFAISNYSIWRRNSSDDYFVKISTLDLSMMRKIVVFKDRIIVSTDEGLLISKPSNNIYSDSNVEFETAFPSLNRLSYISPATSLNLFSDILIIGTEERLYISKRPGNISLITDISNGIIPTIYIDGVEQKIGYRFTTSTDRTRKFLCFDEKQKVTSKITVANQYQQYYAVNGGWADTDFKSKVILYANGKRVNDGSISEKPILALGSIRWPVYNDRNANKSTADIAFSNAQESLSTLLLSQQVNQSILFNNFTSENVRDALFKIEKFTSQLYINARVIEELDSDGVPVYRDSLGNIVDQTSSGAIKSYINFVIPSFNVNLISCNYSSSIGISSFGVYNTLYNNTSGTGLFGNELDQDGNASGSG